MRPRTSATEVALETGAQAAVVATAPADTEVLEVLVTPRAIVVEVGEAEVDVVVSEDGEDGVAEEAPRARLALPRPLLRESDNPKG